MVGVDGQRETYILKLPPTKNLRMMGNWVWMFWVEGKEGILD